MPSRSPNGCSRGLQAMMGVGVADYDADGWSDIFKTNFSDDTSDLYATTVTAL
jgi:hypothetical protein